MARGNGSLSAADFRGQFDIAGADLRTALRPSTIPPFHDIGAGDIQCGGDGLHGNLPDLAIATARSVFLPVRDPALT
jgi:hypothetical protein